MRYIAKKDTWFKENTEVELIDDYRDFNNWNLGLFRGIRICENPLSENKKTKGEEYFDEEVCSFDEFGVINE